MTDLFSTSSAVLSDCGRYRYRLEREGPGDGKTVVIMVNPSTADADVDDATIRKLKGFGQRNAWGRIIVGNLFAFRATDVRELASAADPIGPENDTHLRAMMAEADRIVLAWGRNGKLPPRLRNRWEAVLALSPAHLHEKGPFFCLGSCDDGHPKHPLTLGYDTPVEVW